MQFISMGVFFPPFIFFYSERQTSEDCVIWTTIASICGISRRLSFWLLLILLSVCSHTWKKKPSIIFALPLKRFVILPSVGKHALQQYVLFDFTSKKVSFFLAQSIAFPSPTPLSLFSLPVDELGLIRLTQPRHSSGSLFSFKRTPQFPPNFL